MPRKIDWKHQVRLHLPDFDCSAEHEAEIVEELGQLLEDASRDYEFASQADVDVWLEREIPDWADLAQYLSGEQELTRPLPHFAPPSEAHDQPGSRSAAVRLKLTYDAALTNLRFGLRRLAHKPAFTAIALLSLAVGIGANAAIFSFAHALMDNHRGLEAPEELVNVYLSVPAFSSSLLSYPDYRDVRDNTHDTFVGVTISSPTFARVDRDGSLVGLMGEAVSGNYFELLGIETALGRPLTPQDDVFEGGHPVVVLGYRYWQDALGSDPAVIGTEMRISGRPYTVVGVASEAYAGIFYGVFATDVFVPVAMVKELMGMDLDERANHSSFVKARLRPGISLAAAQGVVDSIGAHLREQHTKSWDEQAQFLLVPSKDVLVLPAMDSYLRATGWILILGVALVLLMACTNLTSFLLADAVDRRKEVAVRLALGAGRRSLIGQLLTESVALALCGGTLGAAMAVVLLRFAGGIEFRYGPMPPIRVDVGIDPMVLGYTLVVSLAAGIALGLAPALRASKPALHSALKDEGSGGGQPGKMRLRGLLVGAQVAGSTVLLIGAALYLRSIQQSAAIDPGFGQQSAAVLNLMVPSGHYSQTEGGLLVDRLEEAIARLPGVEAVGVTSLLQLNGFIIQTVEFDIDGVPPPVGRDSHVADSSAVDGGFFGATGIRLVDGRNFNVHDTEDRLPVAIVSEAMAQRFWPGESAIGRRIRNLTTIFGEAEGDVTVVGVASDTKVRSLDDDPYRPFLYRPFGQTHSTMLSLVARTSVEAETLLPAIQAATRGVDPDLWQLDLTTMRGHLDVVLLPRRVSASALSVMAGLALALSVIGLYGAVSYAVSSRTREIGIRMSLGADGLAVLRLSMATGLWPVLAGTGVGLAVALALGQLVASLRVGVGGPDPFIFVAGGGFLLLIALVAAWLPSRRACRIDPVTALRFE